MASARGLRSAEWRALRLRCLFLAPPRDAVALEQGRLLLDAEHAGALFVKGVWVADLAGDRLATGADFKHLALDRDRAMVTPAGGVVGVSKREALA